MEAEGLREFRAHRPRLFALAYRLLGAASAAEAAVQEAYLRWSGTERRAIRSAEVWLTAAIVNLCRSRLDSARAQRETYPGPWLPEPVPTANGELGPLESMEEREQVSLALLTALERLSPVERAAFVLRETFGYAHREIADMLGVTEVHSQQIFRDANAIVRDGNSRFEVTTEQARELIERLLAAVRVGDIETLERMLATDATAIADGGGLVDAAPKPVDGAEQVARYLVGLFCSEVSRLATVVTEVNGAPAVVVRSMDAVVLVAGIDVADDVVTALRLIANPDKLAYIGRKLAQLSSTNG